MDQDAFRSLLSAPKQSTSTANSAKFGAPPPKRSAGGDGDIKKLEFKPRNQASQKKWKKKKETTDADSAYRDRAAERRLGKDGDFAAAEKLLEDFKVRMESSEDKEALQEQMKYLGGDAEHSVLVKGLDMALLERMKFQQSLEADQSIDDIEAELDKAITEKPKKRTRDEMIADLKAARGGVQASEPAAANKVEEEDGLEKAKAAGRFKPIAKSAKGKEKEKVKDGELKKRKKKKAKVEVEQGPPPAPIITDPSNPSPSSSNQLPTSLPLKSSQLAALATDDADDDIFGGVGEYDGLGSDSDDSDGEAKKRPSPANGASSSTTQPPSLVTGSKPKPPKYFDDDDDDEDPGRRTTAPSAVSNLAAAIGDAAAAASSSSSKNAGGAGGNENEEEDDERPMRLQPLTGSSVPSVRDLLEMDKAAEKEELRKARKLNNKGGAGESGEKKEKHRTETDKANHDYQVMQKFLADKDKKKRGEPVDDD
ncbi:hypothetical protein T439DRAFT_326995 [Meredithblackwellia eburnea MCA 4105]